MISTIRASEPPEDPQDPEALQNAQAPIAADTTLWRLLRDRQLGRLRFRRQHAVGRYLVDFYCSEAQLAIELDGGQHQVPDALLADDRRTLFLAAAGIELLRFRSLEVLEHTEAVLELILRVAQFRRPARRAPAPPRAPIPLRWRGAW